MGDGMGKNTSNDRAAPGLRFLSDSQVAAIRDTAMRIVSEIGVKIQNQDVFRIMKDAPGASADDASSVVKIAPHLVEECLKLAPKSYTQYGRDATKKVSLGVGQLLFKSTPADPYWADAESGTWRPGSIEDTRQAIDLADELENIDVVGGLVEPAEVPAPLRPIHIMAELVKRTRKPPRVWMSDHFAARSIVEMLQTVAGGPERLRRYPMTHHSLEPISPLRFGTGLDAVFEFASAGLPIIVGPLVQTMLSGPATLAGTAALCMAENLAGLVIIQRIHPGTPVSLGAAAHATNPRTLSTVYGSPEQGLLAASLTQVIKSYGLPAYANAGYGDSKVPDAQAGLEKGMTLLLSALAGADSFAHAGVAGTIGASLVQMVVDDEMMGYLRRIMRGFQVSPETLAFDVIQQVGIGGTFSSEEHTLNHLRQEYWEPHLFDWDRYDTWIAKGRKTMLDRAIERKNELLRTHTPELLDAKLSKEIDRIVAAADREYERTRH